MKDPWFVFVKSGQNINALSLLNGIDCSSFLQCRPAAGLRQRTEQSNPSCFELSDLCLDAFSADPFPFPIHTTLSRAVLCFTTPLILGVHHWALGRGIPGIVLEWTCRSAALCLWTSVTAPTRSCGGTGEVCVTLDARMLLQRRVWKANSVGNSSGYRRLPQGSMNRASRRQLIHAVLWSMQ